MPTAELTDKFVKAAKCVSGRKTDYFDTLVKGLVLRASAGGQKTWYAVYGPPSKRRWLKLGTYPEISLGGDMGARQRAKDVRAKVGDGGDPVVEKKAHAAAQTVSDLVDNYVARHASTKRTGPAIARRLNFNVVPVIGTIKLADLHRRDLTRCIDAIKDRGAHVEANRVFEDMRAMIRWARGRGDLDQNLMEGMRKPTETVARDRVLTAEEIRTLWASLDRADMWKATRRVIRLCLVTAQRVGEVSGMAVAELDLENAVWTIPPERAKNGRQHDVPLSDMAIDIIREQMAAVAALAERKGYPPSPHVFPGVRTTGPLTAAAVAQAIGKHRKNDTLPGVGDWTCHDLRRTAATHMEEIGISPFVIGHVLNHASVTAASITSRVYARYDYSREKREALDLWSDRLTGIIEGKGNVVPLRREAVA